MATIVAIGHNPAIKAFYAHHQSKGKEPKVFSSQSPLRFTQRYNHNPMSRRIHQNIVEHASYTKKSRFGLFASTHAPSTRRRNSRAPLSIPFADKTEFEKFREFVKEGPIEGIQNC